MTRGAMKAELDCFIGIKPCGCKVAVVFDDPRFPEIFSETLTNFHRSGYRLETANWDSVRDELGPCKCNKTKKTKGT